MVDDATAVRRRRAWELVVKRVCVFCTRVIFFLFVKLCQNTVPRFTNNFSAVPTVAVPFAFEYGGYSQLVTTL